VFKSVARTKLAKTDLEKKKAWRLDVFQLGRHYSLSITVFVICMSYSLILPYILLAGMFYFGIRFIIHKHVLCTSNYIEYNSKGLVPELVLRALLICVSVFWFISGCMFMLTTESQYMTFGTIICFIAILSVVFILVFEKYIWSLAKTDEEEASALLESKQSYLHPVLKRSAEDSYTLPE
jgi:hypothetical protein